MSRGAIYWGIDEYLLEAFLRQKRCCRLGPVLDRISEAVAMRSVDQTVLGDGPGSWTVAESIIRQTSLSQEFAKLQPAI